MSVFYDLNNRGLPVHPLILLPNGRIFVSNGGPPYINRTHPSEDTFLDLLDQQCFSSALQHAIHNPPAPLSDSIRRPDAVSWLNLELNPRLKNDVVAVIMPIIGWTKTSPVTLPASGQGELDAPCYVEMHHCMRQWHLTQLLSLRLIIAVPWPDLIPFHGRTPTKSKGESPFLDLGNYAKQGIKVRISKEIITILTYLGYCHTKSI